MATTAHADLYRAMLALVEQHREAAFQAIDLKTPYEWNDSPRNKLKILGWSDFNGPKDAVVTRDDRITWDEFRRRRSNCSVLFTVPFRELTEND